MYFVYFENLRNISVILEVVKIFWPQDWNQDIFKDIFVIMKALMVF